MRHALLVFLSLIVVGLSGAFSAARAETESASTPDAPTPDAPTPDAPVEELTKLPQLKTFVQAVYPAKARDEGMAAEVLLRIDIDAAGDVEGVEVLQPAAAAGYGFDEAAVAAARAFVFVPAEVNGVPVPVQITYKYRFTWEAPVPGPESETRAAARAPEENLRGRLLERGTRAPLAGIRVTVFRGEGDQTEGYEASTDAQGVFSFFDLAVGAWRLVATPDGYYPLRSNEEIRPHEKTTTTYYVERVSYNPFDVTVTASKPRKEVSRTSLQAAEIEKVAGTAGDPIAVVQNLPSVARTTTGSGLIVVRGSAPEDSRVFVDGIEIPLIYHFGGLRSAIPAGMLQGIDFYPGNFTGNYGRAIGGILDVRSKRRQPERLGGYLDVSLMDTSVFVETPIGRDAAIAVGGRQSYLGFVIGAAVPDDAPVQFTVAPQYHDYQLIGTYRLTDSQTMRLFFFASRDELKLVFKNPADIDAQLQGSQGRNQTTFYRAIVEHRYVPSTRLDNVLSAAVGTDHLFTSFGNFFLFDIEATVAQLRNTTTLTYNDRLTLLGGIDAQLIESDALVEAPSSGPPREGQIGALENIDLRDIAATRVEGRTYWLPALFAAMQWYPLPGLFLRPEVRVDYFERIDETHWSPRFTGRYALDLLTLKAGAGVYYQEPTFDETDPIFGNPDLGAEMALHYSAGFEVQANRYLSVDITGFYKDMRHLVSIASGVGDPQAAVGLARYDNGGSGRVIGIDTLIRHAFAHRFFGWISYTLSRAERTDSGEKHSRLFDFDQTHIFAAVGTYKLPNNWDIGFRWRYVTGNLFTPSVGSTFNSDQDSYTNILGAVNSARLPPFSELDIRVDKRWIYDIWTLNVYLELQNAYSRSNADTITYNYDHSKSQPQGGLPILPIFGLRAEL